MTPTEIASGARAPEQVQFVRIGLTKAETELLLEFADQHLVSIAKRSKKFRTEHAARYLLALACGLPPAAYRPVIRYICRYGDAEGFNQWYLLNQFTLGALAEWRGDGSGTKGLRPLRSDGGESKTEELKPEEVLAMWRREMDDEEKREMIETMKFISAGLESDIGGGGLKP